MKRTISIFLSAMLAAILGIFLTAAGAKAQSTTDGAIGGTVVDASGAAVAGAKVTVRNNGTNAVLEDVTNEDGFFRVTKLTPAVYTVSVEVSGFAPFRAEQVTVQVGTVTDLPIHLQVGTTGATVLVTSEVPQINTTSADFAPIVDQTFDVCRDALSVARLNVGELDQVLLVGGSTRIPLVKRRVEEFFRRAGQNHLSPDEVVAMGAAIQASALAGAERRKSAIPPPPAAARRASTQPGAKCNRLAPSSPSRWL